MELPLAVAEEPVPAAQGPALTSIQAFTSLSAPERRGAWPLDLVCDVLHYDPVFARLWIRDAAGGASVSLVGEPLAMKTDQRVRLHGMAQMQEGRIVLSGVSVEVLGDAPSMAVPLENWRETNPALVNRVVVAEGLVDRQVADPTVPTHMNLFLSVQGRPLVVSVFDPALPSQRPTLTDQFVRVTGVYNPRGDAAAPKPPELLVSGLSRVETVGHLASDPRFSQPPVAVEALGKQSRGALVRVVGRVRSQERGRLVRLRDGTGQVDVISAQTLDVNANDLVEAIGLPQVDGSDVRLVEAVFRRLNTATSDDVSSALLEHRLTQDVLESKPGTKIGQSVRIRGVVTWSHPDFPYFFVQDKSGGLRVQCEPGSGKAPPTGFMVDVRGVTAMGAFAPELHASEIIKLGESALPEANDWSVEHLFTGVEHSQWVEMRGYVWAVEPRTGREGLPEQVVRLTSDDGDFDAMVPTREDLRHLVGAVVDVRGVCVVRADEVGKLIGVELLVPEARHIRIDQPALVDVFATKARRLETLGRFDTIRGFGKRARVEGTVVHAGVGRIILSDKSASLVTLTRVSDLPKPGDRVEAVGFLDRRGSRVIFRETVYRSLGPGSALAPTPMEDMDRIETIRDGHLVRVSGSVLDAARVGSMLVLTVQRGSAIFSAQLEGSSHHIQRGSEVMLTGAYDVRYDEYGQARAVTLLMRDDNDLVVTRPPSPFTTRRVLAFTGGLAVVTLAIVVWVVALRRRVRHQTAQLRMQLEREGRLQRELERAQRLESLGYLAGGIAHDFNNLLTVVLGNITLAHSDAGIRPEYREALDEARRAILQARDLTQQLLTFSKGGAPTPAATDLAGVVREVAEFALHGSPVQLEFRVSPDLWPAHVDKAQISQVVRNLVLHGAQAMPQGGRLEIELANDTVSADVAPGFASGRYVRLIVRDHGGGISAEDLPRIFDPYFSAKSQGSTLGLATAYSIVKRHRGRILAESTEGSGTCFRLWLPAIKTEAEQAPAVRAVRRLGQPPVPALAAAGSAVASVASVPEVKGAVRVLVMDDESSIRRLAQAILRRAGYDVTAVGDGEEAVREYVQARESGNGFAVVIFDLTVPGGMGGRLALAELKKIDPAVRAIVSSGYSDDPSIAEHRELGFVAMIPKPYEMTTLVATVRSVVQDSAC